MYYYYIILLSLILSAFFSGIEIAYISSSKLKLEIAGKKGNLQGRILNQLNRVPSYFIGALLVGNNIALVVFGIAMAKVLEPFLIDLSIIFEQSRPLLLLAQTLISTLLILIIAEFIPKLLFRINPNALLVFFAIPVGFIFLLLFPLVALVIFVSKFLLNLLFGIKIEESKPVLSRLDLEAFVKEQITNEESEIDINADLFENALYLIKVKVKECMIPRTEIIGIDIHFSIDALKNKFIESKLSRLIVFDESIDNILGYVHHHDLLKHPKKLDSIIFPIPVIPETMPAMDALNLFTKKRGSIAMIVDEFGGTAGIVTLEDILEEIFGEIEDEHDQDDFIEKTISENEYIFSARLEIDYLNDQYKLNIPQGEYETLGGFILDNIASIPKNKQKFTIGRFEITVLNSTVTKIVTVKLKILIK
jgi:magnesium and cobalt exporter, CNNM family